VGIFFRKTLFRSALPDNTNSFLSEQQLTISHNNPFQPAEETFYQGSDTIAKIMIFTIFFKLKIVKIAI